MSDVLDRPVIFEEPVPKRLIKPERPRLKPVFLVWGGTLTVLGGFYKADEAYAEAIQKFFGKTFEDGCTNVREACFFGRSFLMQAVDQIAETKTAQANDYVAKHILPPFTQSLMFDYEKN